MSTVYNGIGDLVRMYRIMNRMSQDELASQSGLSRIMIQYIEAGTRIPSIESLTKIAVAMKLKLEINFHPNFGMPVQLPIEK